MIRFILGTTAIYLCVAAIVGIAAFIGPVLLVSAGTAQTPVTAALKLWFTILSATVLVIAAYCGARFGARFAHSRVKTSAAVAAMLVLYPGLLWQYELVTGMLARSNASPALIGFAILGPSVQYVMIFCSVLIGSLVTYARLQPNAYVRIR